MYSVLFSTKLMNFQSIEIPKILIRVKIYNSLIRNDSFKLLVQNHPGLMLRVLMRTLVDLFISKTYRKQHRINQVTERLSLQIVGQCYVEHVRAYSVISISKLR